MLDPAGLSLLRNATLEDGTRVDVELGDGRVTAVLPAGVAEPTADELDLDGYLLLPAPADPHAHLDKARSWNAIRPPMGDLVSAITAWREYAATMAEEDVVEQARVQALAMLAQGTTAIRTHVDIGTGTDPMLATRALVRVRDELAPLLDLELVALAGPETTDRAVEEALDLGVDLVGGAPHLAEDPYADLGRLLAIAKRRGVGVDLHVDESLDGPVTLDAYAQAVRGWAQNVSAGHCCRLGTLSEHERARVIAEVRASDVGIIANPVTNLYLQGWQHPTATPRGLTPARELVDAGVRFAAGADNVRDPFNPLGRSDALETAMLLVVAGHLTVTEAYAAVSSGAREVMRLPVAGPVVGGVADLLAVRGADLAEVVASAPADRLVLRAGRLVARTTTHVEVAQARTPPVSWTPDPAATPLEV